MASKLHLTLKDDIAKILTEQADEEGLTLTAYCTSILTKKAKGTLTGAAVIAADAQDTAKGRKPLTEDEKFQNKLDREKRDKEHKAVIARAKHEVDWGNEFKRMPLLLQIDTNLQRSYIGLEPFLDASGKVPEMPSPMNPTLKLKLTRAMHNWNDTYGGAKTLEQSNFEFDIRQRKLIEASDAYEKRLTQPELTPEEIIMVMDLPEVEESADAEWH